MLCPLGIDTDNVRSVAAARSGPGVAWFQLAAESNVPFALTSTLTVCERSVRSIVPESRFAIENVRFVPVTWIRSSATLLPRPVTFANDQLLIWLPAGPLL